MDSNLCTEALASLRRRGVASPSLGTPGRQRLFTRSSYDCHIGFHPVPVLDLIMVLTAVVALEICAQGTIQFVNHLPGDSAWRVVYDAYDWQLLSGTNYLAQLYVGPLGSRDEDLRAVDYAPVPFKSGLYSGYFVGGECAIAGSPPGTVVTAQVRAWTAISGSTYEQAVQAGLTTMAFDHRFGQSNLISVRLGGSPPDYKDGPPGTLGKLTWFRINPPPYTLEATRSTNLIVLAWPAADTDYVLEASATLRPANWVLVPQTPSVQGDKRVVTEDISGSQKFYRLRRP